MKYYATVGLLFLAMCYTNAQEIKAPRFGKGILNITGKDSTWSMKFATRIQLLGTATWQENNDNSTDFDTNFLIRRARLKFDGFAFTKKLTYKIEIGLSNRDISGGSPYTNNTPRYIYDALIKWNFYKNFSLWAGQTKLPGNVERVISSGNLQFVDRSLLNAEFNIDRDIGLQLRHRFYTGQNFLIREKFALSQGEGRNVTVGNIGGYQYTSRIELLPFGAFEGNNEYQGSALKRENKPKLMIGATYDFNDDAIKTRSNMGTFMETDTNPYETDISTLFLDIVFKYKGFSFLSEYANRNADDPIARNSDGTPTGDVVEVGNGFNVQAGYLFNSNWEISGRYTNLDMDEIGEYRKSYEDQYTFGISKYIVGHKLKVQTDVSYLSAFQSGNEIMARLQMELHF
ncbi:porin [Galbibacter pacificus]|uniref:Porin n=1 Tax=Galbibacter pacificus TaxID=2996052 RepID=A0ABT6FTU8_9FLAO|nr:porin [Galbibacter pacificus]MDG3583216.1 porin [Galbibacter pacificus]MDG3586697.1 porin [Galbibacter pacificus]